MRYGESLIVGIFRGVFFMDWVGVVTAHSINFVACE